MLLITAAGGGVSIFGLERAGGVFRSFQSVSARQNTDVPRCALFLPFPRLFFFLSDCFREQILCLYHLLK